MKDRQLHSSRDKVKTITPSGYLDLYEKYPGITPSQSSWGWKGYSEVWLDGSNDWIYRHLHKMAELMTDAARDHKNAAGRSRRVLNQMARELLLAQSSDWAFIMKSGTFDAYAADRTRGHIGRFLALHDQLRTGNIDMKMLGETESKYNLFRNIDYSVYA